MKCPVCDTSSFCTKELDEYLTARECSRCKGIWIASSDYFRYLQLHGNTRPEKPYSDISFKHSETKKAKICPDCGHILTKFKVGHGLDLHIDHCRTCNGLWLDQNEWEILYSRNLHDELHKVFTTSWQKHIRIEEWTAHREQIYKDKLADDYEKIKELKQLIDDHPQKSVILAYLSDRH